ncbi:unnamed protein product [Moneuplotes crassus]|uniref:Uncharacterized protein n=1 Tax=Euplotes crassus TaxID=5936 RepID=A0AAD2DA61_EUPCR|nr:unnamed protein product [Moneuplotes crassus]
MVGLLANLVNLTKERLDWFNFETKSRQTTQKLIQPILDQLAEDKKLFNILNRESATHEERLKALEYAVFESGKKQTVIDKIYNKISKIEQDRKQEEVKVYQQISNLELNVKETMETFQIVKREIDIIKSRNETIAKNQDSNNEAMFKIREQINSKNEEIETKIEERFNEFQVTISEFQNMITVLETQIDQAAIDNFKTQLASLKLTQGKILRNIEVVKQEKADQKQTFDEVTKINEILQAHTKKIEDQYNHTMTVENFMEKYIPITIQTQISDTLKSIIDKKMKRSLEHYETRKFNDLHKMILDDNGDPEIKNKIMEMAQKFAEHQHQQTGRGKSLRPSKSLSFSQKSSLRKRKTGDYNPKHSLISHHTLTSKASFVKPMKSQFQGITLCSRKKKRMSVKDLRVKLKVPFPKNLIVTATNLRSSKEKTDTALTEESLDSDEGEESGRYFNAEQIHSIVSLEVIKRIEENLDRFDDKLYKALEGFKQDNSSIKEIEVYVRNLHSTFEDFENRISRKVIEIEKVYRKELKESKIEVDEIDMKFANIHKKYFKLEKLVQKINLYMKEVLDTTSGFKEEPKAPLIVSGRANYGPKPKTGLQDLGNTKTSLSLNKSMRSPNTGNKPNTAVQFRNLSNRMNLRSRRIDLEGMKSSRAQKPISNSKNYETPVDLTNAIGKKNVMNKMHPFPFQLPQNSDRLEPIHNKTTETINSRDLE